MKRIFWSALFFLFFVYADSAQAMERILSFHSDIKVQVNGSMRVTETIQVIAEGSKIRHGIYRDFPTHYRGSSGENIDVDFNLLSVSRDGQSEEFRTERQSNGVRIYMGSKNAYVSSGEHTYVLTYTTDRQLGFFKDHDELYWNVTGNGWDFAMDTVSAAVTFPSRVSDAIRQVDAYTGTAGSGGKDFHSERDVDGGVIFQTSRSLQPREGLTIVVTWPKGLVWEPTASQRIGYFLKDNRGVVVGGVGLVILFLFFLFVWAEVGRDPAKGVIMPLYYPPDEFSPSALRYLMKMGFDNKVLACAVIGMAVKGYLTITEEEDGVTVLTKTGRGDEKLSMDEKALANGFFRISKSLKLANENHPMISKGIADLKVALANSIEKNYFVTNQNYFVIGLVISFVVMAATALLGAQQPGVVLFMSVWLSIWTIGTATLVFGVIQQWRTALKSVGQFGGALFITIFALPFVAGEASGIGMFCWAASVGVVVVCLAVIAMDLVFYHLLKAPTLQGRKVMDQVEGFKMYLGVAEKESLKMMSGPKETPELFEQYLPYALALDVEQAWSERFSEVLAQAAQGGGSYAPSWYRGTMWSTLGYAGFASGLGSSLSSTISSSSVAPGSSSGGGGGGSSGGGGGGGGGGGW